MRKALTYAALLLLSVFAFVGAANAQTNTITSNDFYAQYTFPHYGNTTGYNDVNGYLWDNRAGLVTQRDYGRVDYSTHTPLAIYPTSNDTIIGTITLNDGTVHNIIISTRADLVPFLGIVWNTNVSLTLDGVTSYWNVAPPYVDERYWPGVYVDIGAPQKGNYYNVLVAERHPYQYAQMGAAIMTNVTTGSYIIGYTLTSTDINTKYTPYPVAVADYQKAVEVSQKSYLPNQIIDLISGSVNVVYGLVKFALDILGIFIFLIQYWYLWLALFEAGCMVLALDKRADIVAAIQEFVSYNVRAFEFLMDAVQKGVEVFSAAGTVVYNIVHALIPW